MIRIITTRENWMTLEGGLMFVPVPRRDFPPPTCNAFDPPNRLSLHSSTGQHPHSNMIVPSKIILKLNK